MKYSSFETPVLPLLQTVFTAILEVFLLCLVGYILASYGILDKRTQKQFNRLNIALFTPSLLFSKVAFFLSPAKLRELWIIPIFFVFVTVVSMSVSFLLGSILRLKPSQKSFAMAAAMFMNSNSLPIALMQSLVVTVHGLKWDDDDNKNAMLGRALSYLVMYSTLGMVLRWSFGVKLLSQADSEPSQVSGDPVETSPLLRPGDPTFSLSEAEHEGILRHESSGSFSTRIGEELIHESEASLSQSIRTDRLLPPTSGRLLPHFYHSFPNSPNASQSRLVSSTPERSESGHSDSETDEEDTEAELGADLRCRRRRVTAEPTSSRFQSFLRRSRHRVYRFWKALNDFMTVPLWAALASLVVACIQPLQHALEYHMQAVKGALNSAGNCSIPVTLIVLGAYFYPQPNSPSQVDGEAGVYMAKVSTNSFLGNVKEMFSMKRWRERATKKKNRRPGETKTVVIAVLSRMVITPLLILPMMALSTAFNLHSVFDDPVFVLVNVLLVSSPPALTLAQITQAASGDAFERLISRTIFWSYCVVTPPAIIINVVIGLLITKL